MPIQKAAWTRKSFEYGTWGGEICSEFQPKPGETVAVEHWCSKGVANTDLDLQLKRHGIHQVIVIGLIAHTCIEATVRFAAELGYDVTLVRYATADYTDEMMHAALDINAPAAGLCLLPAHTMNRQFSCGVRISMLRPRFRWSSISAAAPIMRP